MADSNYGHLRGAEGLVESWAEALNDKSVVIKVVSSILDDFNKCNFFKLFLQRNLSKTYCQTAVYYTEKSERVATGFFTSEIRIKNKLKYSAIFYDEDYGKYIIFNLEKKGETLDAILKSDENFYQRQEPSGEYDNLSDAFTKLQELDKRMNEKASKVVVSAKDLKETHYQYQAKEQGYIEDLNGVYHSVLAKGLINDGMFSLSSLLIEEKLEGVELLSLEKYIESIFKIMIENDIFTQFRFENTNMGPSFSPILREQMKRIASFRHSISIDTIYDILQASNQNYKKSMAEKNNEIYVRDLKKTLIENKDLMSSCLLDNCLSNVMKNVIKQELFTLMTMVEEVDWSKIKTPKKILDDVKKDLATKYHDKFLEYSEGLFQDKGNIQSFVAGRPNKLPPRPPPPPPPPRKLKF